MLVSKYLVFPLLQLIPFFLFFLVLYSFKCLLNMKKTNPKILEEIIRVDHAGERGAIKIYEGQLLALKTIKQDKLLQSTVEKMKDQEKEHLEYFEKEIQRRKIKPTYLLPLWDIMGVTLGFGTAMLGKKAAMLCTASVEEVIENHYENQLEKLGDDEKDLKSKIKKFKEEEIDHKNIAYESGATNKGAYSIMDKIIRTGSRIAITISEKI